MKESVLVIPKTIKVLKQPIVEEDSPEVGMRTHTYVVGHVQDPSNPNETLEDYPLVKTLSTGGERTEDGQEVTFIGGFVLDALVETKAVEMDKKYSDQIASKRRKKLVNIGKNILAERGLKIPEAR